MCCSRSSSTLEPLTSTEVQFDHNHADEADIVQQLKKEYEFALDEGNCLLKGAHSIVNVVLVHVQNQHGKNSGVKVHSFLQQNFLLIPAQINEKYGNAENAETLHRKIKEYKLQSLLLLEMESVAPVEASAATCIEKLTLLLRMLSIIAGPYELNSFIHETLVESYSSHLRKILEDTGDELNIPLFCKDHSSPLSVNNDALYSHVGQRSGLACRPGLVLPGITYGSRKSQTMPDLISRSRKTRFPMMGDLRTKRQIMVPKLLPSEHKSRKLKTERLKLSKMTTLTTIESSWKATRLQATKKGQLNVKKIRRTLFGNDSKTSSTAPSGVSSQIPYSFVGNKTLSLQGPCSPTESSVLETPLHKQGSLVRRQKAHLKRKWNPNMTVDVIDESPIKVVSPTRSAVYTIRPFRSVKASPTSHFDIQCTRSRNLEKARARMVADRIRGDVLSPRNVLFAELLNSPSVAPFNDLDAHSSCSVGHSTLDGSHPNVSSTTRLKISWLPNASASLGLHSNRPNNTTPKSHAKKVKKIALDFNGCGRANSFPVGSMSERLSETVDNILVSSKNFLEKGLDTLVDNEISKQQAESGVEAIAPFVQTAKCPAIHSRNMQSDETVGVRQDESLTVNSTKSPSRCSSEVGFPPEMDGNSLVDTSVPDRYICRFTRSKSKVTGLSPSSYFLLSQASPHKFALPFRPASDGVIRKGPLCSSNVPSGKSNQMDLLATTTEKATGNKNLAVYNTYLRENSEVLVISPDAYNQIL